jgi:hypothetical protein
MRVASSGTAQVPHSMRVHGAGRSCAHAPARVCVPQQHHHHLSNSNTQYGSRAAHVATAASSGGSTDSSAQPEHKLLTDAATRTFLDWATAAGITSTGLAPATFAAGLRGMAAVGPIKRDGVLVSVPRGSSIVLAPRARCPFTDCVQREYWETAPWFVKMALMLLHERTLGEDAPLGGYLKSLPQVREAA